MERSHRISHTNPTVSKICSALPSRGPGSWSQMQGPPSLALSLSLLLLDTQAGVCTITPELEGVDGKIPDVSLLSVAD